MLWFLALLAIVLGVLALPVEIRFSAAFDGPDGALRREGRLRWAFGLVRVALGTGGREKIPRPRREVRRQRPSRFNVRRLVLNPNFWMRLKLLLRRLLGAVHWRRLRFHARVGMDDPADTGRLSGLVSAVLAPMAPGFPELSIEPVFDGPTLSFQCDGEVRLIPLQVAWVLLSFAAAPTTWRVLWPAFRGSQGQTRAAS